MSNSNETHKLKYYMKALLKYITSGLIVMWLVFWYISGSPLGMVKYFYTYYITSRYFMTVPTKNSLFEGSLKGMLSSLGEPHSQYLDKEDFSSLMQQTEGAYSGVGIVLGQHNGNLEVISAVEEQPAALMGIQSGDIIEGIDGVSSSKLSLEEASKMIRGEAGTEVTLKILHNGESKEYTIKRERILLPTVKGKMLEHQVGYIRISQFAETSGDDFAKIYQELEEKGMNKLVLDLRDNPGGLLTTAQAVANYVLPAGPLVSVSSRVSATDYYESKGLGKNIPLVVLVNKGSASASEIIAGAVQDRKAGTILGMNTYGKGTVQTVVKNFDNEGIKITIAKYHTPNDRVIDGVGIKPDIEVDLTNADRLNGYDVQLEKALAVIGGSE